ncbi:MAG: hypothetical protein A3I24_03540 [Candidatus Harrisonbacteria bacterium RIFCSPLOWO2_02_FULL_41_13b]|uniref:Uncharacterized protein n=1 Tax=Candidatus Harrisonbacteria bacterium RIFCSPLOWO2_02_FULL_41_13b TaxID=1798409 RepID=A0A1G1ZQH6_9BACT|nr:MAG: hypothetical protein A3I24_03540 [Candidatus Harrisonbacteria bacterium RIFCSPLOWO2_02_FULL_41_13b]
MNKKVYIIHGWDGSPNEPMLQWLKVSLEERGCEVVVPEMPEPAVPKIGSWVGRPDAEVALSKVPELEIVSGPKRDFAKRRGTLTERQCRHWDG